jgi:Major Facilitator Superfamily
MKRLYSKRHLSHKSLVLSLYIATIFYSLHYALTLYLGSSFLVQFIDISRVGLIFIISAALTTYVAFELSHFLNTFSNYRVALTAATLEIFTLLLLSTVVTPWIAIVLFIIQQILVHVVFVSLSISLSEVSRRSESGSVRGVYFTVLNFGILSAAFLSGLIFTSYKFTGVYIGSALLLLPVLYIIYRYVHSIEEPYYKDISFLETIKKISSNKDIKNIVIIQFVLECFFAAMVVYTTPYLAEVIGISTGTVLQVIMPFALLPFIIFPYELGVLADTKIGEKELIFYGIIIAAVFTLMIPFITTFSFGEYYCL